MKNALISIVVSGIMHNMEIYTIQHPAALDAIARDGYFRPPADKCMDNVDGYLIYRLCYRWMIDRLYEKCGLPLEVSQSEYDNLKAADDELYRVGWKLVYENDENRFPCLSLPKPCLMPHPVWGFQKAYGKTHAKPDMRSWTTDEPEEVVRIRLDIPEERLLFSDLEYWHIPLNNGYFPSGSDGDWEEEDEKFDQRCREAAKSIGADISSSNELFSSKITHMFADDENAEIAQLQREFLESWRNVLVDVSELGSIDEPITFREQDWISRETQCVFWEIREEDMKSVEHFTTRAASQR